MITLFEHNQIAYESAIHLLAAEGKAAIIHPTGTGKSFIAFKLCEERPEARICWLSPSEYIYRIQLENVKRVCGFVPKNVTFLTYAKLMLLTNEERIGLRPDIIILDEFHRCGAAEWGKGIKKLLSEYPNAGWLGLTATNIRYLDNQRDMADELFDGVVAHRMTLGESVVRGILPAPKYIMAMYVFRTELERYARRAHKVGGAAGRRAECILDKLRRKLEKADGIDVIFHKHMQNKTGKYIMFCSDHNHMERLVALTAEWFGKVDAAPHIYKVYAESPEALSAFERFKTDESDHLKLLFCIDMLNEGIHVEGLSGVILCRPTVSPIVYKQQVGRALSALKDGTPVIFDLVDNIENLNSIFAVREEMDEAITYYRNEHREDEIVQNCFDVIDEVRECRELFEELESTLAASWDMMYAEAEVYYQLHGHLDVPKRYRTQNNLGLGNWIQTQRMIRRGTQAGNLTEQKIKKLDKIGMIWQTPGEQSWENGYEHAKVYHNQYGHLDVPARYICEDGFKLGRWISNIRASHNGLKKRSTLSAERAARLDELGMIWSRVDFGFEHGLYSAARYAAVHGNLRVPVSYVDEEGFKLGRWLAAARSREKELSDEKKRRLTELGMEWQNHADLQWEKAYQKALTYYRTHGDLNIPSSYQVGDTRLGRWLSYQRELYANGRLLQDRIEKLEAIGMVWKKPTQWDKSFAQAKMYYETHGNLLAAADYVTSDGLWLDRWIHAQRKARTEGKLTSRQLRQLDSIGISWVTKLDAQWMRRFEELAAYYDAEKATEKNTSNETNLRRWYVRQCKRAENGLLEPWQVEKLEMISISGAKK